MKEAHVLSSNLPLVNEGITHQLSLNAGDHVL